VSGLAHLAHLAPDVGARRAAARRMLVAELRWLRTCTQSNALWWAYFRISVRNYNSRCGQSVIGRRYGMRHA